MMPRVLIADDDAELRETVRWVLEDVGYEVLEAPHGRAALELLRADVEPLVVLLDVVMPYLSGMDLLILAGGDERLARHAFVVWTAGRMPVPPDLLERIGVPIVPKPCDLDTLLEAVAVAGERLAGNGRAHAG
jgi:CheY-like chemotaxis protein